LAAEHNGKLSGIAIMCDLVAAQSPCDVEAVIAEFLDSPLRTSLELPPMSAEARKKAKALVDGHPELKCDSFGWGPERRLHVFKVGVPAMAVASMAAPVRVKNTFIDDWAAPEGAGDAEPVVFRSMPVRLPTFVPTLSTTPPDSPSKVSLSSTALPGGAPDLSPISEGQAKWPIDPSAGAEASPASSSPRLALPTVLGFPKEGLQIRNTFVHFEGAPQDDRAVQSMPHNMFRKILEEEEAAAQPMAYAASNMVLGTRPPTAPTLLGATQSPAIASPQKAQCRQMLLPGMRVIIRGLTKLPAFNGKRAIVEAFNEKTGRYAVALTNPIPGAPKTAKVRGENLIVEAAAAGGSEHSVPSSEAPLEVLSVAQLVV